jgi:DNA-binding NarL/FixJ family response regulator
VAATAEDRMPASVVIAMAEPFVRIGIDVTVRGAEDFDVVRTVDDAADIVPAVSELKPDVLILDSHFQQADDQLMRSVLDAKPECNVLVLVDHTDEQCTVRRLLTGPPERWPDRDAIDNLRECCLVAFRESARGCLPKASTPDRLLHALRTIVDGGVWAGPGLSQYLVEMVRPSQPQPEPAHRLTRRELDVIGLLVEGLSNREIAERLGLSEQTVKNHIARIMAKVEVRNRVELVLYAVRERLA